MKMLTSALLAAALLTGSSLAMAHDHGYRGDNGDRGWSGEHDRGHDRDRRDHDRDRHDRDREHDRDRDRHDWDREHGRDRDYDRNRRYGYGYGHDRDRVRYDHRWERGHRYDGRIVVVHDYDRYRLRQPPRGYRWVRGDTGQYLLVAVATGIIMDIVLH